MKKIILMITIAIVSVSLLTGCYEYSNIENSIISDSTVVNVEIENQAGVEEVSRIIDNRIELGEVLRANLTQIQITDMRYEIHPLGSTIIDIFFTGDVDNINSGRTLEGGIFTENSLEHIIRANILTLEEAGLSKDDVQRYWVNHWALLDGDVYISYHIDLFQLREPRVDGSNMLLSTGIPAKIRIDVESIMAEQ